MSSIRLFFIKESGLANEEEYEVNSITGSAGITNGPRKARLYKHSFQNNPLPIFEKYAVWCQPPFSTIMPKSTLYNLFDLVGVTGN